MERADGELASPAAGPATSMLVPSQDAPELVGLTAAPLVASCVLLLLCWRCTLRRLVALRPTRRAAAATSCRWLQRGQAFAPASPQHHVACQCQPGKERSVLPVVHSRTWPFLAGALTIAALMALCCSPAGLAQLPRATSSLHAVSLQPQGPFQQWVAPKCVWRLPKRLFQGWPRVRSTAQT